MSKNMKPVTQDILSAIYQSTLQVGSGYVLEDLETERQKKMAQKIISRHGIADVLVGFFYAYSTIAEVELVGVTGERSGTIQVQVGTEIYALRPFFIGLDAFMYHGWPDQMEVMKMKVINKYPISVQWGIDYLNFPYNPDKKYNVDLPEVEDDDDCD